MALEAKYLALYLVVGIVKGNQKLFPMHYVFWFRSFSLVVNVVSHSLTSDEQSQ